MRSVQRRRPTAVALLLATGLLAWLLLPSGEAGAQTVDDKRNEAQQIAARLAELQDEQMELGAKYERANYERSLAEQRANDAQAQADETNAALEQARTDLRDFAVSAYQNGNDGPTGAVLKADQATNGAVKRYYLESTTGDRGDLIDALKTAQRAADEDVERLEAARSEAEAYAAEIEDARAAAADATAKQDALNSRAQGELAQLVAQETAAHAERERVETAPSAATGSGGANAPAGRAPLRPAPAPTPEPEVDTGPAPSPGAGASGAISAALSKVGSPYVWGAAGPSAFDCSGLVLWAYARVGVSLPHYSGAQYAMTTRISASQLQPGDLVFWGPGGSDHVAIYMGGNQLVHAFPSGGGVGTTPLNGWWKTPSGYGRLNY